MDKTKLLNLMRFWLFGTFIIVFAAVTVYILAVTGADWMKVLSAGLPIWGLTAVLCVIWYFVYQWYLNRKK
jgi:hypothetical protein